MLSATYAAPTVRKISNIAIRIYGFSLYLPDITHIKFEYNYMLIGRPNKIIIYECPSSFKREPNFKTDKL